MENGSRREIWHHAVVAGVVAITVFLFEATLSWLNSPHTPRDPLRFLLLLAYCAAAFVGVFILICLADWYWESRKVPLAHAGRVDGCWSYVVRDGISQQCLGASICEIRSGRGEFRIDGLTCALSKTGGEEYGDFAGEGRREGNSIVYNYRGRQGAHNDLFGVGYYRFGVRDRVGATQISGEFLSSLKPRQHRVVEGEKLAHDGEIAWCRASLADRRSILKRHLKKWDQGAGEEREDFVAIFGKQAVNSGYKVVFLDAKLPSKHSSGPTQRVVLSNPPPEAEACGALPKGIHHIVPFEELEGAVRLDQLFKRFGEGVEICLDRYYRGGDALPPNGCLSVGLGFNNLTSPRLSEASNSLYWVTYPGGTDDFRIRDEGGTEVDPSSRAPAGTEYALLARILVGPARTPYLVIAGHTGYGTVAACNFILERWREIVGHYKDHQKDLHEHHMAAILFHPKERCDASMCKLQVFFKVTEAATNAAKSATA
ncbi:MAG TPA: hypothetical protein VN924_05955 [Bryobacteraceae bacterium]|nr:hypothetical protein [Bryobacteraceae bacterium]